MLNIKIIDRSNNVVSTMRHGERSKRQREAGIIEAVKLHQRNPNTILRVESSKKGLLIYSEGMFVTARYYPEVPDVRLVR
jgi:hypothetical protein